MWFRRSKLLRTFICITFLDKFFLVALASAPLAPAIFYSRTKDAHGTHLLSMVYRTITYVHGQIDYG